MAPGRQSWLFLPKKSLKKQTVFIIRFIVVVNKKVLNKSANNAFCSCKC